MRGSINELIIRQADVLPEPCSPFTTRMGHGSPGRSTADLAARRETLDHLVFAVGLEPPSFIKADIDGAEFAFLKGAERAISLFSPKMIIEVHSHLLERQCAEFLERGPPGFASIAQLHTTNGCARQGNKRGAVGWWGAGTVPHEAFGCEPSSNMSPWRL